MIRASGLSGRSVVDLDTADRVGEVDEVIVDPYAPGIAGFVVVCDRTVFGHRKRIIVPIEAVHAIGPDALTIRSTGRPDDRAGHLDALPRLGELIGRRIVSYGGRLLGVLADASVDERDGRIVGYPLERVDSGNWLGTLFGRSWQFDSPEYVRADGGLRVGPRMIVVPDGAICSAADFAQSTADETFVNLPPAAHQFGPTPAEIREAQATTTPFALDAVLVRDVGLGLQLSTEGAADGGRQHGVRRAEVEGERDAVPNLQPRGRRQRRSESQPDASAV